MPVVIEDMNVEVAPPAPTNGAAAAATPGDADAATSVRQLRALLAERDWQRARLIAD